MPYKRIQACWLVRILINVTAGERVRRRARPGTEGARQWTADALLVGYDSVLDGTGDGRGATDMGQEEWTEENQSRKRTVSPPVVENNEHFPGR
jgi:hypothetical protein